ncbi:histone acetyltransferase 1 [Geranomyces michiganensis]|nr:histone acetyltransferase 1 [Geranomyces michiganensis]
MTSESEPITKKRKIDGQQAPEQVVNPYGSFSENGREGGDSNDDDERPLRPWEVRSNEAISLRIADEETEAFHPDYSYEIFGQEEVIYGYKDVDITISYSAASLFTHVNISHGETVSDSAALVTRKPDDVLALLRKKLPPDFTQDYGVFLSHVRNDASSFVPFGTKLHEYSQGDADVSYEIYSASFRTPGFVDFHRRLQVFLLWYIEGASYLQEDDEAWEMVLLYERRKQGEKHLYSFVGYATYYPFYYYSVSGSDKRRVRISQFLVLPPFQENGHGAALYRHMYDMFLQDNKIVQLTVEDPNESFCILRDKCDLAYLIKAGVGAQLQLPVPAATITGIADKFKLTKRQAERCVEMMIMRSLGPRDANAHTQLRLHVKRRIWNQTEDVFATTKVSRAERIQQLEEMFETVEERYREILHRLKV